MKITIPRPAELIVEIAMVIPDTRSLDDRQRRELALGAQVGRRFHRFRDRMA